MKFAKILRSLKMKKTNPKAKILYTNDCFSRKELESFLIEFLLTCESENLNLKERVNNYKT